MGKIGIGKRIDGHRSTFLLERVTSGERIVYDGRERKIHPGVFVKEIAIAPEPPAIGCTRLTIRLLTPLRLKYENRLKAELPFHVLTRALLRRISTLCDYYDSGEPPLDYRGIVARAQDIATESSTISWFDWRRYSNRQDQSMLMGGMVGETVYRGEITEFLPLIRFGEAVHLGKQTAFGLGKIALITGEGTPS